MHGSSLEIKVKQFCKLQVLTTLLSIYILIVEIPLFRTREDLMVHVAEKIPQLKSRTNPKQTQETQQQPQQGKQAKGKKRK